MTHPDPHGPQPSDGLPAEPLVFGGAGGPRTLACWAPSMRQLMERLQTMLAEHVTEDDEIHVSYSAMQAGWHEPPPRRSVFGRSSPSHVELVFEYSALVVVRPRASFGDR